MPMFLRILLLSFFIACSQSSRASHIYGLDFYYTHLSGNDYTITLAVYGDCSGAAFPALSSGSANIDIYDGGTMVTTLTLDLQGPGEEISPICPAQFGNTKCSNPSSSIPGIMRFIYSANITLPYTSSVWRFIFAGDLVTSQAGRSNSITNVIVGTAGSIIQLTDTLNNTSGGNSSPQYNTVPTPYFCVNSPANYNPAVVDGDGDALVFALAPAMESSGLSATYVSPYTYANPVGVTPGSFSLNSTTGQLSFTPNIIQQADIVYNVREFSGGILTGTSQREMTLMVLSECPSLPPSGVISNSNNGVIVSNTAFRICSQAGAFGFNINPVDPEHDTIVVEASGLPSGATFTVTNNNTPAPSGRFEWNTTDVPPGTYVFYINYHDLHCPLIAAQSIAYTVTIYPSTLAISNLAVSSATCAGMSDGAITVTATGGAAPFVYALDAGMWNNNNVFSNITSGTHIVQVKDTDNCVVDTTAYVGSYPPIQIDSIKAIDNTCNGNHDGSINLFAGGGTGILHAYIDSAAITDIPAIFSNLTAQLYMLHVKDELGCIKDTVVTVHQPDPLTVTADVINNDCINDDTGGRITLVITGGTAPYNYLWSPAGISGSIADHLANGSYSVSVSDVNGCTVSAVYAISYDNCCTPYLPNAFSPNGDGHNDFYRMVYKGNIELIEFSVYNRFGERVFLTKQINDGWNGTYKDIPCDIGTYYYYIKLDCGNRRDKILEFKGDVTLVK